MLTHPWTCTFEKCFHDTLTIYVHVDVPYFRGFSKNCVHHQFKLPYSGSAILSGSWRRILFVSGAEPGGLVAQSGAVRWDGTRRAGGDAARGLCECSADAGILVPLLG